MEASITLKKVSKRYDKRSVITDLSLGIEKGTSFTVIGRDGAGKSTLLKILAGLNKIDSGQVYIKGQEISQNIDKIRKNIGYLPPYNIHDPWISGQDNLEKYKEYANLSDLTFQKRYQKYTSMLQLQNQMEKLPNYYSKGLKRRLDILLVLIKEPDIFILDEPLKNLDYKMKEILLDYLNKIKESKTIVIATDEFREIETVTDRWIVLHNGTIRYDGNLEKMVEHVDLDFTGHLEIKKVFREKVTDSLKTSKLVKNMKDLGNTIEIKTESAEKFWQLIKDLGEDRFCRIAGNSVNMHYLLDQLTSDEGYE
ncbi:MAG: ABC transporter ATP-binding protein [Candidatus Marinimicrobia bacterium]|nr:ABC transporter ATP-binding protein [Candidatus Neomarinimicrobiota bacterium]